MSENGKVWFLCGRCVCFPLVKCQKQKTLRIKNPKEKDMTKTLISITCHVSAIPLPKGQDPRLKDVVLGAGKPTIMALLLTQ